MNKLDIVRKAADMAGIGGGGPSILSTENASNAEIRRLVSNVEDSWLEIQLKGQDSGNYWRWMRREFELRTRSGQYRYAYSDLAIRDKVTGDSIDTFRNWLIRNNENPPILYRSEEQTEQAQTYIGYVTFNQWRLIYSEGRHAQGHPIVLTISPSNELVTGPTPDQEYRIDGSYIKGAQKLLKDTDVPDMPEDFHNLIVWMAVVKQGMFDAAHETVAWAEMEIGKMDWALRKDQYSQIYTAGALC